MPHKVQLYSCIVITSMLGISVLMCSSSTWLGFIIYQISLCFGAK